MIVRLVKKHWKLILAILYVLSPIDILPEFFLGPVGYIDDVTILLSILGYKLLLDYLGTKLGTDIDKGDITIKKQKT